MSEVPRGARGIARLGATAYVALLAVALVVVLVRSPRPITPVYEGTAGCSPQDLAHYCRGVRARVSSYDVFANHHPIFAIDGRHSRDLLEKWVSGLEDASPWIELLFPEPVDFSTVRLIYAGYVEPVDNNMRSYRLSCSAGDELRAELAVHDNEASRAQHALKCVGVDRLRIDLDTEPDTGRAVVRLYEIEVAP
jgi:hypothetical protein